MQIDQITDRIIGAGIEVHRELGPGLLEGLYERALHLELAHAGLQVERQKDIEVFYKGTKLGVQRLDLLVEEAVVVELKSVDRMHALYTAQLLNYMRLGAYPLGLLINFNNRLLKDGVKRFAL